MTASHAIVSIIISTTFFMQICILAVADKSNGGNSSNIILSTASTQSGNLTLDAAATTTEFSNPTEGNSEEYFANYIQDEKSPLSKNAQDEPVAILGGPKASGGGATYGSCYLELNTTGDLANSCLRKTNADGSIKDVFLAPDQVKPADIGMYCSIWIKAKLCEIKGTCEQCPNEGALAEHFLKDSARRRFEKYCHSTEVTFSPLEATLCDVTPSSKTGLIITVVVLVLIILGLCAFICFYVPVGGKGKKGTSGGDEKSSSSSKAKQAGSAAGSSAAGTAGSKGKPSKVK